MKDLYEYTICIVWVVVWVYFTLNHVFHGHFMSESTSASFFFLNDVFQVRGHFPVLFGYRTPLLSATRVEAIATRVIATRVRWSFVGVPHLCHRARPGCGALRIVQFTRPVPVPIASL